jgi:hypothetical protein
MSNKDYGSALGGHAKHTCVQAVLLIINFREASTHWVKISDAENKARITKTSW